MPRKHAARILDQELEQLELGPRQLDLPSPTLTFVRIGVEGQVFEGEHATRATRCRCPTLEDSNAREQLVERE